MKPFSGPRRYMFIPLIAIAFLFLISGLVMTLWNGILPAVFGFHVITFWQAMGILVLCKILFGFGFKGHKPGWGRHMHWQKQMGEQFANMTPEERNNFKEEWRRRAMEWRDRGGCRPPFSRPGSTDSPGPQQEPDGNHAH